MNFKCNKNTFEVQFKENNNNIETFEVFRHFAKEKIANNFYVIEEKRNRCSFLIFFFHSSGQYL